MKKYLILLVGLFSIGTILGQILTLSQSEVNFGQVNINTESFVDITVTNISEQEVNVSLVENSHVIEVDQVNLTLSPNQSTSIHFTIVPETNIIYNHTVFFNIEDMQYTLPLKINVAGRIPDSRYNSTYNKWDAELKTALTSIISNHSVISYEDARVELFGYIANEGGQVRCVYTNEWYSCTPGGIPNWNLINTEHTWPQSMGAEGTAKSDLHHLFPTNSQANSIRGNYPFGQVVNASWQEGGSKKGSDLAGNTVFEPRDDHKGDTARALFYFALRYNNPSNFLNSANQQMVLRDWYYEDPVSSYEIDRNAEIVDIQNKPNPFIEYPMLLDRIANITHNITTPRFPEVYIPYNEYTFPETELNEISSLYIPITNSGDTDLTISTINFTNSAFQVGDYPSTLAIGDWGLIEVNFTPTAELAYAGNMQIFSNTDLYTVNLQGNGQNTPNSNDAIAYTHLTLSNYPNPFNNHTTMSIHGIKEQNACVEIYNIKGQRVKTISNFEVKGGNSQIVWNGEDETGHKLASGLYFAKIQSGQQTVTKKMLIMK
ncbi:endonuclease [bacterium]|nr:endonuclease [bacterium]